MQSHGSHSSANLHDGKLVGSKGLVAKDAVVLFVELRCVADDVTSVHIGSIRSVVVGCPILYLGTDWRRIAVGRNMATTYNTVTASGRPRGGCRRPGTTVHGGGRPP